jgi:hypothetical protein
MAPVSVLGRTPTHYYLGPLQPAESTEFVLAVKAPIDRNPLYLHYRWLDGRGEAHTQVSKVTVPRMRAPGPSA